MAQTIVQKIRAYPPPLQRTDAACDSVLNEHGKSNEIVSVYLTE
jgi:hypothetical protein